MSSSNPLALGTVSIGVSTSAARGDHVHPTTGLALSTHDHAGVYSVTTHDHAGVYAVTAHAHDAAYVNATGDTMTGDLVVSKSAPRVQLYQSAGVAVSLGINGAKLAVRNETNAALTQVQAAAPATADDLTTKAYVDAHTHAYLSTTGGQLDGRLQINTSQGLTLHSPSNSVVSLGAQLIAGRYCLEVTDSWDADTGALAPLRIGSPVNGESAARVDWVQSDRAAASHGSHAVYAGGSYVGTTDGAGQMWITWGGGAPSGGIPLVSNGDWPAHSRAPHIGTWNGASFRIDNLNAGQAFRANWIVM